VHEHGSGARLEAEMKCTPLDVSWSDCGGLVLRPSVPVQHFKRGNKQVLEGARWPELASPVMWLVLNTHYSNAFQRRKRVFRASQAVRKMCECMHMFSVHPTALSILRSPDHGLPELALAFRHMRGSRNGFTVDDEVGGMTYRKYRAMIILHHVRNLSREDLREFVKLHKNDRVASMASFFHTSENSILHSYIKDGERALGFVKPSSSVRIERSLALLRHSSSSVTTTLEHRMMRDMYSLDSLKK
jgi:hypothetical protein